jgi:hypothetical protein
MIPKETLISVKLISVFPNAATYYRFRRAKVKRCAGFSPRRLPPDRKFAFCARLDIASD